MKPLIFIDTRQQISKHLEKDIYFKEHGCDTKRTKLFVGDYTKLDQRICVDTKRNILELAGNICGKQHERFRNECIRAQEAGIQLVVLIEQVPPDGDLSKWTSKHTQASGETLGKAMRTMTEKYGVRFEFCRTSDTAKRIVDILFEESKNGAMF